MTGDDTTAAQAPPAAEQAPAAVPEAAETVASPVDGDKKKRKRAEPAPAAAASPPDAEGVKRERKQAQFFQVQAKEKAEFVIKPVRAGGSELHGSCTAYVRSRLIQCASADATCRARARSWETFLMVSRVVRRIPRCTPAYHSPRQGGCVPAADPPNGCRLCVCATRCVRCVRQHV